MPPRSDALGRELHANSVVGEPIYRISPDRIDRAESIGTLNKQIESSASAGLDLTVQKVSANIGAEYSKTEKINSRGWQIIQIKNVSQAIAVNRRFIYQCLGAASTSFEVQKKVGASLGIDASQAEIAQAFGVEKAKVEIKSKPAEPDKLEVKVDNPNVCLAYVAGTFVDDNDYIVDTLATKFVNITGKSGGNNLSNDFSLTSGDTSNFRTPQFVGAEPFHKPQYRLMALRSATGKMELHACRQDMGTTTDPSEQYTCKPLPEDSPGRWNRTYHVDTFTYLPRKYKSVFIEINARVDGASLLVASAKLRYPQYVLKLE